jgi:hypothetical protein
MQLASPGPTQPDGPAVDPREPISPELVLVSPELRELAFARLDESPPAPRTPRVGPRSPAPAMYAPAPAVQRLGRWVATAAAVVVGALVTAAALTPTIAGDAPVEPTVSTLRRSSDASPPPVAPTPTTQRGVTRPPARAGATHGTGPQTTAMPRPGSHAPIAAQQPGPTHSSIEAERNVLRSPAFFRASGRRSATVIDSVTGVFRTNTTVACVAGPPSRKRAHVFLCVVRHGSVTVRVRYIATGRKSFRLRLG